MKYYNKTICKCLTYPSFNLFLLSCQIHHNLPFHYIYIYIYVDIDYETMKYSK